MRSQNPEGAGGRRVVCDFADDRQIGYWRAANDVIMGGDSGSSLRPTGEGTAAFSGTVVLEGGGFASVRHDPMPPWDLSGFEGLELVVKGDGKRYAVTLRSGGTSGDHPTYRAAFAPQAGTWETVTLPLAGFEPFFRGRTLDDAPPLDETEISSINLLISERQGGAFRLEVERVSVC